VGGSLDIDGGDYTALRYRPRAVAYQRKDIRLDGVTGDVRISNNDGAVELHINKLPVGNLDINNRNADVADLLARSLQVQGRSSTDKRQGRKRIWRAESRQPG